MAVRACNVSGIGQLEAAYELTQGAVTVNAYELILLGYLVLGNRYFMSVDDWLVLSSTKQLKNVYSLWNHRVMIFRVKERGTGSNCFEIRAHGQFMSIHDPVLNRVAWWDIDARPLL